jgi:hypothetical protein
MPVTTATNPAFLTGFIPCKKGDVIRFKNCFMDTANGDNSATYGNKGYSLNTGFYNSNKEQVNLQVWTTTSSAFHSCKLDANGLVTEMTILYDSVAYVRLCLASTTGNPADAIVTVNEEITE